MTDKEAQLKAKLLKMKLAGKLTDYQIRNNIDKSTSALKKEVPYGEDKRSKNKIREDILDKSEASTSGKPIQPKKPIQADRRRIITAKAKVNKLKKKTSIPDEIMQEAADAAGQDKNLAPSYIAQDHKHSIVFKGHRLGGFRGASLNSQSGKFAKYWLLNAKETNGNGWGIAAHTAKDNMKKFIGRPLVVTAKSWHGASEYGEEYEHPYLPTNDISAILRHQDKFRVGSIVDVFEDNNGDWFANIEMLPKFANRTLPPFCSPAIYQLDAKENEGQISKWEALHLAALNENPAYGARIALLKGTCIGTGNECQVQFKSAKLEGKVICTKKLKGRVATLKKNQKTSKIDRKNLNKKSPLHPDFDKNFGAGKKIFPKNTTAGERATGIRQQGPQDNEFSEETKKKYAKEQKVSKIKLKLANLKKKQKIAVNFSGGSFGPDFDALDAFKAKKRYKSKKFESTGDTLKLRGHTVARHHKEGIEVSNAGHDTPLTYSTIKGLGIHARNQKGVTKLNNKEIDVNSGEWVLASHKDISDKPIKYTKTPGKRTRNVTEQSRFRQQVEQNEANAQGRKGKLPLSQINIQPNDQKRINKITGVKSPVGKEILGVDAHHILSYKKNPGLRTNPNNGIMIPKKEHKQLTSFAKLKSRLANLGEQNMTYQDSKKVKIIKKKHPEVRKAKSSVEDILRGQGRSVDGSHSQSTFLSSSGDFIGDNRPHRDQVNLKDDEELFNFQKDTGLIRVQKFPINRAGEKRMSFGINSKPTRTQLKSIQDSEIGGHDIGFSVGPLGKETTGRGYKDLTKSLRGHKLL